jgi:hypothetical protein
MSIQVDGADWFKGMASCVLLGNTCGRTPQTDQADLTSHQRRVTVMTGAGPWDGWPNVQDFWQ